MSQTIRITVDGRPIDAPADRPILYAMLEAGIAVPHYCYHPGLSIAGNCRMCLVKVQPGPPKPQVACNTFPREGMVVLSETDDEVARVRESIMEFLLINHPLDCPVCDQAGECWLQDYAHAHGRDVGRFREAKVHKHTKRMGEGADVRLWGERCIACSRCVRFTEEVSGGGEICLVERGDRTVVDVHPEFGLTDPLAGNTVDICPVGALVSDDFLFKSRVWNMTSVETICPACAKGCNITVESHRGDIKRLKPRVNLDVNGYWMCDRGRFDYAYVAGDQRLQRPGVRDGDRVLHPRPDEAVRRAVTGLVEVGQEFGDGSLAVVADLWMTNEELLVTADLARRLGATVGVLAGPTTEEETFPGFTIPADKNPNREGARRILGESAVERGLAEVVAGLAEGRIKGLYLHLGIPHLEPPEELVKALERIEFLVYHGIEENAIARLAHIAIPGAAPFERSGTMTSGAGVTQRLRRAVRSSDFVEADLATLQRLVAGVGDEEAEPVSDRAITKRLAAEVDAYAGLTFEALEAPPRRPNYRMNPSPEGLMAGRLGPEGGA